jgi:ketosteroid isomerase-like protein
LEATSMQCTRGVHREARLLGCVLLVAMSVAATAQAERVAGDESARVLSLENAWNQAEVTHDTEALSALLAETFDFTDDDGQFMNKSQWLAYVRNGEAHYAPLGNTEMKVHLYGNVAVATGIYQDKVKEKGKWFVHSGRFTDIWTQQNGAWKCVASQATLISH